MIKEKWREVLKEYNELVYICLSSGLSEACNNAIIASREEEFVNRVFVVNTQRVAYMNKMSIQQARMMINEGKSGKEIKEYLEQTNVDPESVSNNAYERIRNFISIIRNTQTKRRAHI